MQHLALLERRAHCPVEAVFQIEVTLPFDDMCEEVAIEGRVLGEKCLQVELALVVTNWSSRTGRGATSAHSRVLTRPWSGYGLPFPMRLKITRKAYRPGSSRRSSGAAVRWWHKPHSRPKREP